MAAGELTPASNVAHGVVEPPAEGDVTPLPEPGSDDRAATRSAGLDALASGRVAQVVLAGGMATRFGGVVKGAVEAVDGRQLPLVEARRDRRGSVRRSASRSPSR